MPVVFNDRLSMSLLAQFIDGCGRLCSCRDGVLRAVLGQGGDMPVIVTTGHGVPQVLLWLWTSLRSCRDGVSRDVEMPQIQFIAPFEDFQLCNRDGFSVMHWVAFFGGYGGDERGFGDFFAFFALLRDVPESSASFRSPRALTPVSARGLLHNFMLRVCGHTHSV